jgi:hypothetical protein
MKKIVDGVNYYQVVFTMPDDLPSLALGNRRVILNLLFHAAWKSLKKVLEAEQAYEAAASMVLHTWNQHLDAYMHLHAVVPGGGPISDARLLRYEHGQVTFTARTGCAERPTEAERRLSVSCSDGHHAKARRGSRHSGETEEVALSTQEFVRRWCLHILPPGFPKTRCYGGYSNHHCQCYVAECCKLRRQDSWPEAAEVPAMNDNDNITNDIPCGRSCPTCGGELECVERVHRTSWRDIVSGSRCPSWNTFRERPG